MKNTRPSLIFWTELIAFDVEAADLGIPGYFARAGMVPGKVLLFLWSNDLIHSFDAAVGDAEFLRDDCCSYGGHLNGDIRMRQRWRRGDLKRLIALLQERGIEVYLSVMDQLMTDAQAKRNSLDGLPPQWSDRHREVCYVTNDGSTIENICPLKRLNDGSYYQDFFAAKLLEVLEHFHFDGYHGADGFIHLRLELFRGDFSDDMLGQFAEFLREDGKKFTSLSAMERAGAIWQNYREEWIAFYVQRQTEFWQTVDAGLRRSGKKLVVNSIWTRDPLEARYRYGFDYRILETLTQLDGVVVESVSTVLELEGWGDQDTDPVYKNIVAAWRIKALLPQVPLYFMNAVTDIEEQFFPVRHVPMRLESEILWENSGFIVEKAGSVAPVFHGITCCLACGLDEHEWEFLRYRWELALEQNAKVEAVTSATVVFSPAALDRELASYCREYHFTSNSLHVALLAEGAAVAKVIPIDRLAEARGPLVVLHEAFFPDDERELLRNYRNGEIFRIGLGGLLPERQLAPCRDTEPTSWVFELPHPQYPQEFIAETAAKINTASKCLPVEVLPCWVKQLDRMHNTFGSPVIAEELQLPEGRKRILLRNNQLHYQDVRFRIPEGRKPQSVLRRVILFFDAATATVTVKLPPCGAALIEF